MAKRAVQRQHNQNFTSDAYVCDTSCRYMSLYLSNHFVLGICVIEACFYALAQQERANAQLPRQKTGNGEWKREAHPSDPLPFTGSPKPNVPILQASSFEEWPQSDLSFHPILCQLHANGAGSVQIDSIPDPPDDCKKVENMDAYFGHLKAAISQSLPDIIAKNHNSGYKTKFVIYDSIMPWAFDVAREFGLDGAPFLTQSCSILAIYHHFSQGTVRLPFAEPTLSLPSLPPLQLNDFPSLVSDPGSYPAILKVVIDQYPNFRQVSWMFCSSFDMLEDEVRSTNSFTSYFFQYINPFIHPDTTLACLKKMLRSHMTKFEKITSIHNH